MAERLSHFPKPHSKLGIEPGLGYNKLASVHTEGFWPLLELQEIPAGQSSPHSLWSVLTHPARAPPKVEPGSSPPPKVFPLEP